ncbi:abortive infection bacteriophage resistance protein [Firmicutes bacterium CAG:313]|nr:abortive infection bacteriophage resistance protein [Firmicutes bacterium CAG:313]
MTIDEQVNFLKNEKKLKFKSEKLAKRVLQEVGYYKLINAYKIPFIINNQYLDNVYFEDIYNLYKFDTELKTIVFEAATNIEINFKSLLSEVISSQYGIKEKIYLKKENFAPDTGKADEYTFAQMKKHIKDSIKKQVDNMQPAVKWYNENYKYFPFWVVVNILTIGSVSRIYGKLKDSDKIIVAKNYKLPYDYLGSYIRHINLVRNICAHNDVLYRYKSINSIPQKIKNVKDIYEKLGILKNPKTGRYFKGSNDFLATIIIFKLLLSKENFNLFYTKFKGLLSKLKKTLSPIFYEKILDEMGLPENWFEIK